MLNSVVNFLWQGIHHRDTENTEKDSN